MIIPGANSPTTCALYDKLAAAPVKWVRSPAGRAIIAKALRHVRRYVHRREAAELRDALYVAWGMAEFLPSLATIERRYSRQGGAA